MSRAQLDTLAAIAREAGAGIMQKYSRDVAVQYKAPGDPVTQADRDANAQICARLRAEFPEAAIVAEESPEEAYAGYRERRQVFFVDPLDGTREFVAHNGQFVVMIGLLVDDLPELGVIYAPATATLWCGGRGVGAYRVDASGVEQSIRVGDVKRPEQARVTVSRSRRSERLERVLRRISPRLIEPMGSAGLKGSHVAEDRVDAYLALGAAGKFWDACALDALVTAAGGVVTDARGRRLDYRSSELELRHGILASNPELHQALLPLLAQG